VIAERELDVVSGAPVVGSGLGSTPGSRLRLLGGRPAALPAVRGTLPSGSDQLELRLRRGAARGGRAAAGSSAGLAGGSKAFAASSFGASGEGTGANRLLRLLVEIDARDLRLELALDVVGGLPQLSQPLAERFRERGQLIRPSKSSARPRMMMISRHREAAEHRAFLTSRRPRGPFQDLIRACAAFGAGCVGAGWPAAFGIALPSSGGSLPFR